MNKATAPRFPCLTGQRGETAYSLAFEFPRFTSRNKPDAFRIRKYRPKGNEKNTPPAHPAPSILPRGLSPIFLPEQDPPKPHGRNPHNASGIKAIPPPEFQESMRHAIARHSLAFPEQFRNDSDTFAYNENIGQCH